MSDRENLCFNHREGIIFKTDHLMVDFLVIYYILINNERPLFFFFKGMLHI